MKRLLVLAMLASTVVFAGKIPGTMPMPLPSAPTGPATGPGTYIPAHVVTGGEPVHAEPGTGVIGNSALWYPSAVVDTVAVSSFDCDYEMGTGVMWAASTPYFDSAIRVYRSTDHGYNWNYISRLSQTPARTYAKVGVVVGEGDSSFAYIFVLDRSGVGSVQYARFNLSGGFINSGWVANGPDTTTDMAVCGDQRTDYGLFVLRTNDYREGSANAYLQRSFDFGRTWDASPWNSVHAPNLATGANQYLHVTWLYPMGWEGVYYERNNNRGDPSSWDIWANLSFDTFQTLTPVVAAANTTPESTATVWVMSGKNWRNSYDYDVWFACRSLTWGDTWRTELSLASSSSLKEYDPDIKKYKGIENPYVDVAYFFSDTLLANINCVWRWAIATDPATFGGYTQVNDSGTNAIYSLLRPKILYSPGAPGTGGGVMYYRVSGGPPPGHGIVYDAPWFPTGVADRSASVPVVRLAGASVSAGPVALQLPGGARTVMVYDAAGRQVRRLAVPLGATSLAWDGLGATGSKVSPGVYYIRVETASGSAGTRVTIVR